MSRPEYREDLTGIPHYDKSTGEYLDQHRHVLKHLPKSVKYLFVILMIYIIYMQFDIKKLSDLHLAG